MTTLKLKKAPVLNPTMDGQHDLLEWVLSELKRGDVSQVDALLAQIDSERVPLLTVSLLRLTFLLRTKIVSWIPTWNNLRNSLAFSAPNMLPFIELEVLHTQQAPHIYRMFHRDLLETVATLLVDMPWLERHKT